MTSREPDVETCGERDAHAARGMPDFPYEFEVDAGAGAHESWGAEDAASEASDDDEDPETDKENDDPRSQASGQSEEELDGAEPLSCWTSVPNPNGAHAARSVLSTKGVLRPVFARRSACADRLR